MTKSCAPINRVSETTPKGTRNKPGSSRPRASLDADTAPSEIPDAAAQHRRPAKVSWRPQNILQIHVPETLLTNEPSTYGPGLLSERCRESGIPLTRRRRRRLGFCLIPSGTCTGRRGGTKPRPENCRVTTKREWASNFRATGHSAPLNLLT